MKRDRIKTLKHNAKLDVRLPDQLKDEFLARCREEGVSSGAVIRSLILDYVTAQPRRVPAMAARLKETIMKRAKWIAGGLGGSGLAGLAAMSVMFAPTANADEIEVEFALHFAELTQFSNMTGGYTIALGEPMMIFADNPQLDANYGLIVKVSECSPLRQNESCELFWEVEVFEALDWHENELGGVSVIDKRVLAAPRLSSERGASISFEIGAEGQDDAPSDLVSAEFLLRSADSAP